MTSSSPKPSLPLDVLSRCRSKCEALTILSIMQDKSKKKIQPQSMTKLLIRFHWKCRPLLWQTNFILYTLAFASPPPLPPAQCFYVYFDARQMNEKRGSLSILCRKTSRKVAAWKFLLCTLRFHFGEHLFRSKSDITSNEVNYSSLHRKIMKNPIKMLFGWYR